MSNWRIFWAYLAAEVLLSLVNRTTLPYFNLLLRCLRIKSSVGSRYCCCLLTGGKSLLDIGGVKCLQEFGICIVGALIAPRLSLGSCFIDFWVLLPYLRRFLDLSNIALTKMNIVF